MLAGLRISASALSLTRPASPVQTGRSVSLQTKTICVPHLHTHRRWPCTRLEQTCRTRTSQARRGGGGGEPRSRSTWGVSTTCLPFCRDQPGRQVGFQPHERPVGWSLTQIHTAPQKTLAEWCTKLCFLCRFKQMLN